MDHVIRCFDRFEDLPESYGHLRAVLARHGLFGEPAWFELLLEHTYLGRDRLCVLTVEHGDDGRPLLLAPMRLTRDDPAARGAQVLATIHHVENHAVVGFAFDDGLAEPVRVVEALFRALRRAWPVAGVPRPELVRLMPLDAQSPLGDTLYAGLRAAGWPVQAFANSFNRYEDTRGLGYAAYFEQRSANMRYSVRRRRRALEQSGALELELVRNAEGLERALLDYLKVAQASWKDPYTMADPLTLAMIRQAAVSGGLRLAVLRLNGEAAAAQFWLVTGRTAHCIRLAYDERFAKQAVGIVLTDFIIAQLLDGEAVEALDFGLGDEDFKTAWMRQERVFVGLLAFNVRSWRGAWQALRHIGGRAAKRLWRRLRSRDAEEPAIG